VFTCIKFIDGLELHVGEQSSKILVKANQKTVAYLDEVRDNKRQEYLSFIADKNEGDPEAELPQEEELKE